jgi:hypothetical protein
MTTPPGRNLDQLAPCWLLEHARNVYSQCGEDGIIEQILKRIPDCDRWCVEFGAWDGRHMSNTCRLIEDCEYSAVLIEGDPDRAQVLQERSATNARLIPVNQFVGYSTNDNLDSILSKTAIPIDFDLLSIDIDGNDYHVWNATNRYQPKVVVIEFNPTIPTEVDFVQSASPQTTQGCSLKALVRLGRQKGYELVSVTLCNAVFVRREYFDLFEISDNRPETLRQDLSAVTWIFSGFDGQVILQGSRNLPWHNLRIRTSRVQQMPAFFRQYPHSFGRAKKLAFKVYKKLWNVLNHREQQSDASERRAA